jgi:hypothetical protein
LKSNILWQFVLCFSSEKAQLINLHRQPIFIYWHSAKHPFNYNYLIIFPIQRVRSNDAVTLHSYAISPPLASTGIGFDISGNCMAPYCAGTAGYRRHINGVRHNGVPGIALFEIDQVTIGGNRHAMRVMAGKTGDLAEIHMGIMFIG